MREVVRTRRVLVDFDIGRNTAGRIPVVPTAFPRQTASETLKGHGKVEDSPGDDRVVEHGRHKIDQDCCPSDAFD